MQGGYEICDNCGGPSQNLHQQRGGDVYCEHCGEPKHKPKPKPAKLVVRRFYTRAFGEQYAVIPLHLLDEKGLQDRDPDMQIVAHMDGIDASRVVRFDTRKAAEFYLTRRLEYK